MVGVEVTAIECDAAWNPPLTSMKKFFVGNAEVVLRALGAGGGVCTGGGVCVGGGGVCVGGGVCALEGAATVRISPATSHNMHVVFVIESSRSCFWDAQH